MLPTHLAWPASPLPAALLAGAAALAGAWALWRRSGAWAYAAAAGLEVAVALVTFPAQPAEASAADWLPLLRAEAVTAALVALAWQCVRPGAAADLLLAVQLALALAANVAALALPVMTIVSRPGELPPEVSQVGSWPGWVALLLTGVTVVWLARFTRPSASVHLLGTLLLAGAALAACTAARPDYHTWLAYHVLTAGCAACGVLMQGKSSWREPDGQGASRPAGAALAWTLLCGVLVFALAVRGAREDPAAPWPAAAALLFVSGLAFDLAIGRHSPGWAFAAAVPFHLALSLALWHLRQPWDWARDGPLLTRVNVLVVGLAALGWLSARRCRREPWLRVLVSLAAAVNLGLLAGPLAALVNEPAQPPAGGAAAGGVLGWAAALAAAAAVAWYLRRAFTAAPVAGLVALGLPLGVLLACTTSRWGGWPAYRTLTLAWTALALLAFAEARRDSPGAGRRAWEVGGVAVVALLVLGMVARAVALAHFRVCP
jgi:hypothetical protein